MSRLLAVTFINFVLAFAEAAQENSEEPNNDSIALNFLEKNNSFNSSLLPHFTNETTDAETVVTSIGLSILIGFISLFTVAGNIMVILAVVIFRKLRKIPNLLIVSLATADLIMGGIVLPLGAHYAVGSKWLLGAFACNLWTSIDVLSVTASICTLCAISLDRFVAIVMPFEYSTKMTKNRARLIIAFIWITSAAIAFFPINLGWWKTDKDDDIKCYEDPQCCDFRINKTYAVVSSLVSFYIPLVIMMFAYTIVFKSKAKIKILWSRVIWYQIFHYTRCIAPNRVTSWWVHFRVFAPEKHSFRRNVSAMATLCPIWPSRDFSLRPFVLETNEFRLVQLTVWNRVTV